MRAAFNVAAETGDEWVIHCPVHEDDRPSAEVYVGPVQHRPKPRRDRLPGMWYCFSCGAKGQLQLDGQITVSELRSAVASLTPQDTTQTYYPYEWFRQYVTEQGRQYWARRGFRSHERHKFLLGHDETSPVYGMTDHRGRLLGVVQRTGGRPKYRYPTGVAVHTYLFASQYIVGDTVALTEGAVDAMALWQAGWPAVGQYGATLSGSQVSLLRRMGITTVVLAYDADDAGEYARGRVRAELGPSFLVRDLRWRGEAKDPAEIPRRVRASMLYLSQ